MTAVLTFCAIFVVAWFAVGTIWNVRRGSGFLRWMHGGLPLLGERTTVRWLGSTTVELAIRNAKPPFERATVVVFLEPRDMPWAWALSRRRGRRDALIVRTALRAAPTADLEVLDPASWSGRDALRRLAGEDWLVRQPSSPGALTVYHKTQAASALADTLLDLAHGAGLTVQRLSVRRKEKSLQAHLAFPATTKPARDVFACIQTLAERASA